MQEFDFASNIRRAAFAFFAVPGTEGDPEWLGAVERALPDKGAPVVCACERGGRLSNRAGEKLGSQSRSLKAVFLLRQAGYTDVRLLDGGVYEWRRAGLPVVEEEGDDE